MKLKEAFRVQMHAAVYKHRCHCACSPEIGKCIINDAGRQAAQNKNKSTHKKINKYKNTPFWGVESRHTTFYDHTLRVNINIQRKKKKFSNKITKLNDILPLTYKNTSNKSTLPCLFTRISFLNWAIYVRLDFVCYI